MNMILKKPGTSRRGRAGFTLVEVIVVLVILAILAAIAIPALTGYIDKAEDKKYIAQARNAIVAVRTLIDEAYADGTLFQYVPSNDDDGDSLRDFSTYPVTGDPRNSNPNMKAFFFSRVGAYSTPPGGTPMYTRAAELIAINAPSSNNREPGDWAIDLYAPANPSSTTVLDATAFIYYYYPDGSVKPGDRVITVTYGIEGFASNYSTAQELDEAVASSSAITTCSPDAGYNVFHVGA
ncbi:MAG: prepilin-type N-terminal cleavage/methylation domain-containing protein [Clostridiales Family XIII bacterium]|jgi:prepilin-type N-terminal cleavage/methylation domain-containing protein|nr:prepilin-type N-terminal cleavage/methylation domain-containing protein [Clostridiales Family XIII bacterium]